MADQPRKDQTQDLPPKKISEGDEENVKGGAGPINSRPKPAGPIDG